MHCSLFGHTVRLRRLLRSSTLLGPTPLLCIGNALTGFRREHSRLLLLRLGSRLLRCGGGLRRCYSFAQAVKAVRDVVNLLQNLISVHARDYRTGIAMLLPMSLTI